MMGIGVVACDQLERPDPNYEYLMTRVDELEEEVQVLRLKVEQLGEVGEEGDMEAVSSIALDGGAAPVMLDGSSEVADALALTPSGGTDLESQLRDVESRRDSLGLRVRQLESAPRAELPLLLEKMGVTTPSLSSLHAARRGLMGRLATQSAGDAGASDLSEAIRRIDLRIELAADEARRQLIEREQAEAARVGVLQEGLGIGTAGGSAVSSGGTGPESVVLPGITPVP